MAKRISLGIQLRRGPATAPFRDSILSPHEPVVLFISIGPNSLPSADRQAIEVPARSLNDFLGRNAPCVLESRPIFGSQDPHISGVLPQSFVA